MSINIDDIEKFYDDLVDTIQPNKKEFCNSMRGLREFGDKLKSKKPKWFGRFIHIAEYFGVPFYLNITGTVDFFKRRIEQGLNESKESGLSEDLNENLVIKQEVEIYFPILKDDIIKLLKKANTFLKFARKKKEQIQIETYPEVQVETPEYLFIAENDYAESIPEITDINESVLDTKYYLNMFIDILIKNLSEMVEKIKNEMLKFETQTINKSSSMYNNLLKLSFEFQAKINI